jgi:nitrogen regulatory protein PII-like uncharacterized protein
MTKTKASTFAKASDFDLSGYAVAVCDPKSVRLPKRSDGFPLFNAARPGRLIPEYVKRAKTENGNPAAPVGIVQGEVLTLLDIKSKGPVIVFGRHRRLAVEEAGKGLTIIDLTDRILKAAGGDPKKARKALAGLVISENERDGQGLDSVSRAETVEEWAKTGATPAYMAEYYGVSPSTIKVWRRVAKLPERAKQAVRDGIVKATMVDKVFKGKDKDAALDDYIERCRSNIEDTGTRKAAAGAGGGSRSSSVSPATPPPAPTFDDFVPEGPEFAVEPALVERLAADERLSKETRAVLCYLLGAVSGGEVAEVCPNFVAALEAAEAPVEEAAAEAPESGDEGDTEGGDPADFGTWSKEELRDFLASSDVAVAGLAKASKADLIALCETASAAPGEEAGE